MVPLMTVQFKALKCDLYICEWLATISAHLCNFTANCCTSTKAGIVFKCIIMRSTKSSLSLFGTLKSKYLFFMISIFHYFIREVRWPSGTGLGKNWAPKMLWARILFREFLANIFSVDCTSISRKYCCFNQQILLFSQMKT